MKGELKSAPRIDRIIDVNVNRLSEALRMIEDIARFYFEDKKFALEAKRLRADFDVWRKRYAKGCIESRESAADIGRNASYDKNKKSSVDDILGSAFGRGEEACRVLEETSKLRGADSPDAKGMRFNLYSLEKRAHLLLKGKMFCDSMGLYIVMTSPAVGYERLAEAAVKNGVRSLQLRDKGMEGRKLLLTAKRIRAITEKTKTLFIVNDRLDIALLSGADGLHLGQTDIPVEEARRESKNLIIGKSTHSMKQLNNALKEEPDYVGIGPIYPTKSKQVKDRVLGLREASMMLKHSTVPAVGIGGIKDFNCQEVKNAGFSNISVLSYINESTSPEREIKMIQSLLRRKNDTER